MDKEELTQEKLHAEIAHLMEETKLISKKTKWFEFSLGLAAAGILLALGKYLF